MISTTVECQARIHSRQCIRQLLAHKDNSVLKQLLEEDIRLKLRHAQGSSNLKAQIPFMENSRDLLIKWKHRLLVSRLGSLVNMRMEILQH